eukprot:CAMPEP_0114260660 /NCGR_PEP_ID=MMETSP0058-20121206/20625_2 /TAXON_ID=36894 /ORGANISM="Pyramimonas parkeae, CCMP726" /LENGTH=167 /DNA_ID=CAMNT_0001375949 /DNA_START=609 /DNA_END=1112 /DNA_ORIENTATION=-
MVAGSSTSRTRETPIKIFDPARSLGTRLKGISSSKEGALPGPASDDASTMVWTGSAALPRSSAQAMALRPIAARAASSMDNPDTAKLPSETAAGRMYFAKGVVPISTPRNTPHKGGFMRRDDHVLICVQRLGLGSFRDLSVSELKLTETNQPGTERCIPLRARLAWG